MTRRLLSLARHHRTPILRTAAAVLVGGAVGCVLGSAIARAGIPFPF